MFPKYYREVKFVLRRSQIHPDEGNDIMNLGGARGSARACVCAIADMNKLGEIPADNIDMKWLEEIKCQVNMEAMQTIWTG